MVEQPWILDRFDDIRVLRYEVPGFETLPLEQKILIYYLSKATEAGADITYDQNFKYNLLIRDTLFAIRDNFEGERESTQWAALERYTKHIWFANGIHHHYSGAKFTPEFSQEYFANTLRTIEASILPKIEKEGEDRVETILETITPIIFDSELYKVRLTHETGVDVVKQSACNYYDGVTQQEVEEYYESLAAIKSKRPVSHGLNSQLVKDEGGHIFERPYKLGGLYSDQITNIIFWLEKAASVANETQKHIIELLIEYYRTGDLTTFYDYNIAWVADKSSNVDFINGFIEVYGDPLCRKGCWEGLVNFKNIEASHRTEIIAENAQWFEDHAPTPPAYRKPEVTGVSAKVVTVAMLGGDCYPATPIGINLPNAEWIRRDYGSKSVTIDNVTHAYAEAAKGQGFTAEFFLGEQAQGLIERYGEVSDSLHTDMHECLGHGSGRLADGVSQDALGSYHSVIEECRADLFGLYFMADPKMVELGLLPNIDAAHAHYIKYLTNGALTQLARIELGNNVEQTHMRNRKIISEWVVEQGAAARVVTQKGRSFIVVDDFAKLRELFGELLYKIQKMKSEGDIESAKSLVEKYGVKIDQTLHAEILKRYATLNIEPYNGFVNPSYTLVMDSDRIIDVDIKYPTKIW
ncbi:MAG: dihydrofolate reductase [Rikenellaceae bacterium]